MGRSLSTATANDFASIAEVYQTSLQFAAQAQSNGKSADTLRKLLAKAQLIENRMLSHEPVNVSELLMKLDFLLGFAVSAVDEDDLLMRKAMKQLKIDLDRLKRALPAELDLQARKSKRNDGTSASRA